jgi:hypothetical protein
MLVFEFFSHLVFHSSSINLIFIGHFYMWLLLIKFHSIQVIDEKRFLHGINCIHENAGNSMIIVIDNHYP